MRALIIEEGHARGALAASRDLADAGWVVGIGSPQKATLAAWSRSSRHWHPVPEPSEGLDEFVEAINRAIDEEGYEVVFGAGDAEVMALSSRRSDIRALTPWGDHSGVACAFDKLCLAERASRRGLATPKTIPASGKASDLIEAPIVVKARVHAPQEGAGAPSRIQVGIAQSWEEARSLAEEIRAVGGEPLFQDTVSGTLCALTIMIDGGQAVAALQQRAEAIWPVPVGISVRAVSVEVDRDLLDGCVALLGELGWSGLAEIQFIDSGSEYQLIDVNGRFYGSMALARAAGLNFPAAWAMLVTGRTRDRLVEFGRPGVRYQWLEGDLRRAAATRKLGALVSALGYAFTANHSMLSIRDPFPSLRFTAHLLRRGVRKVRRR